MTNKLVEKIAPTKSSKIAWIVVIAIMVSMIIGIGLFAIIPGEGGTTPVTTLSSVDVYSEIDGEKVSGLEYVDLYLAKDSAEFEDWDDITDITINFDPGIRRLASSLTFDLTDVSYAWLCLSPVGTGSGVFNEDWKLLAGGLNRHYSYLVSDDPTDLYFTMLNETFNPVDVSATLAINGTFYIVSDVPHNTTTAIQLHVGTGWDMSTADFALLTTTRQAEYYDEKYWTSYDPLYVATDDTLKSNPQYDVAYFTDCPAFKFFFNDTGVEITLGEDVEDKAVVMSDAAGNQFIVFYEPLIFVDGIQSISFDITFPADTTLTDVDFVRVTVPKGASTPPTAVVKIADIAV